ncbi:hypothetical protein HD554DRAFT_2097169 [Boletus coccyginus]|nr:hypothetical protein HD554DRAFT_2097169 [Boletus coccyginus]
MTIFSVSSLYQWPRHCTPKAREIVLNIINSSKTPLATKDIYNLAIKPTRARTPASRAGEEIRSIRYLKTVLRDLAAQKRVEKARTHGAFTAWLWRQTPSAPARPTKPTTVTSTKSGLTELTPAAVGVGEDWSHLNKRRQRARKMKVERDLRRMLEVQKIQRKSALPH